MTTGHPYRPDGRAGRGGFVLLAVLVFVLLLSMVTLSLMYRSGAEETAVGAGLGSEQAWSAAMSGVREALRVAAAAPVGSTDWEDNPSLFRDRPVADDGADRWFFTVYSPSTSDDTFEVRHGLSDEAACVNVNHPGGCDLERIPRMTPAMAGALRQFVGLPRPASGKVPKTDAPVAPEPPADGAAPEPIADGAPGETDPSAVVSRHGPLASLDELAGIPGFPWSLLRGEDANRNGRLDANEDDGDETFPPDNKDGRLDHGMAQYLTVGSYDPDRAASGRRRTDLNDPEDPLPAELPAAFAEYVAAVRAAHMKLPHPADTLEATVHAKDANGVETEIPSGVTKENLPLVLDLCTTDSTGRHEGRININTAGALVLATLPGVDLSLAETIVSSRAGISPERRATPAWIYQEGLLDAAQFKAVAPFLTARSAQFRFQVLGYGIPSGRFRMVSVSIDVAGPEPRIVELRDITRLGLPFKPGGDAKKTDGEAAFARPTGNDARGFSNG
ncbi:MAG: general secretion pathway protein GspK [Verrucomicrobia bacterium]|nr:MAG: general secretion pathway protein GspK [Verrucomicrobiota bacterium]